MTRIGRRFTPPGHELKHMNWNISVTWSLPAAERQLKLKLLSLENYSYVYSRVNMTRIGRRFNPPGHELKHMN